MRVVYAGEARNKDFMILVNGAPLARETLSRTPAGGHNVIIYSLSDHMLKGLRILIRFEAEKDQWTSVYEIRMVLRKTPELSA